MASKKKEEETELDISSLIDVVFLLIMFFVVTADLDKESYDERVKLTECKFLKPFRKVIPSSIIVNLLSDGRFTINKIILSRNKVKNKLKQAQKKYGDALSVVVRIDRGSIYKYTDIIKKLMEELNITKIRLVSVKK